MYQAITLAKCCLLGTSVFGRSGPCISRVIYVNLSAFGLLCDFATASVTGATYQFLSGASFCIPGLYRVHMSLLYHHDTKYRAAVGGFCVYVIMCGGPLHLLQVLVEAFIISALSAWILFSSAPPSPRDS